MGKRKNPEVRIQIPPPKQKFGLTDADREHRRGRILKIAEQIVTSQIARGELNPEDLEALLGAVQEAASTAAAAYDAAIDHLFR